MEESAAEVGPGQAASATEAVVLPVAEAGSSELLEAVAAPAPPDAESKAHDAPAPVTLRGRVRLEDGGQLPAGLAVYAASHRPHPVLFSLRDAMSDVDDQGGMGGVFGVDDENWKSDRTAGVPVAEGSFELQASPGQVWIGVDGEGVFVSPSVRVTSGTEQTIDVVLVRGAILEGRVVDSQGLGLAGHSVRAASAFDPFSVLDSSVRMAALGSTTSDAKGHFVFPQVPPGVALMVGARARPSEAAGDEAAAEATPLQPARASVQALQAGERRSIELVLRPAGSVSGRVVDTNKAPVPDVAVALRRSSISLSDPGMIASEAREQKDTTDADGNFEFDRVSDGEYEAVLGQGVYRLARSDEVTIEGGSSVTGVTLLAETGLAVSGRVLDPDGAPVVRAHVRGYPPPGMMSFGGAFDRDLRPDVYSAEDGSFRLDGFDAGKVRIEVDKDGFRRQRQDVAAGSTDVELRLPRLTSLSGIVVSLVDGEPVHDFQVMLEPAEGLFQPGDLFGGDAEKSFERIARKNFRGREDGTFTLDDVVPGDYDATVTAVGFGSHVDKDLGIPEDGRRGQVVMLEPESAVFGVVVDSRSATPVPGAVVQIGGGGSVAELMSSMVHPGPTARTDSQGRFRLGGLSAGTANLAVKHPIFRTLGLAGVLLMAGEQRDLGTLRLSKGGTVHGTVFDALGAVPNVTVMVSNATATTLKRATTDAAGHYRIEGLPAGTFNVMRMDFSMSTGADSSPANMMKDMVFEQVTLAEDEERRVDLRVQVEGGVTLSGKVSDAAGPVEGAMLTLMPTSEGARLGLSATDGDGHYSIDHVAPGRYELGVTAPDGMGPAQGAMGTAVFDTLDLGARPEEHHDVVLPGGVLNGVVVSRKDGHAVPDVRVVLERTDVGRAASSFVKLLGGRVGEGYSSADGTFRFRHLPGGTYTIVAGGKGVLGTGAAGWTAKRVENLSVLEGKPGFTVKIEVEPAAVVAGTITDLGGHPLSGVGVWVLDGAGIPRSTFSEVSSDSSGGYEVGDLQPGAWTLAFMDGGHALTFVRGVVVQPEQRTPLDVRLAPGVPLRLKLSGHLAGSLDVSVSGPEGALPAGLLTISDIAGVPVGAGAVSVGTYAPGTYHLLVTSAGAPVLDTSVTLVLGTGVKVLELPAP